ncbi:MAG: hypothetical protein FOGNACKC_02198 [Anaerolineae bacterium]|nr:hypothetical protein [Anaerolineae bacterium]
MKTMNRFPMKKYIDTLEVDELVGYLETTGWNSTKQANQHLRVFEGPSNLEIVLPSDRTAPDMSILLANAIEQLASLNDIEPEEMINKIRYYDRDILQIRNVSSVDHSSVPIELAVKQLTQLKQLIAYAAASERIPLPYFERTNRTSDRMLQHYRFSHTLNSGKFGYQIESRVSMVTGYVQKRFDVYEDVQIPDTAPVERRVMERIVRGLEVTQDAVRNHTPELLIEEYVEAFNANMCKAVVNIAGQKTNRIEFKVKWAQKLQPTIELEKSKEKVELGEASYNLLDSAYQRLKDTRPSRQTRIRGIVTHLTSTDNPLKTKSERSVIIRWTNRREGRPVSIIVSLEKQDYIEADKAHMNWSTVEVSGIPVKIGNMWRLSNPYDFEVTNNPVDITE